MRVHPRWLLLLAAVLLLARPAVAQLPALRILVSAGYTLPFAEIVSSGGIETLRSLAELEGKTIGVVNGYRYPLLDPLFEAGRLQRAQSLAAGVRAME